MPMPNDGRNKLSEECGELVQAVAKFDAYPNQAHPDGIDTRTRLEDEIADVLAACDYVIAQMHLDHSRISSRRGTKFVRFVKWSKETEPTIENVEACRDCFGHGILLDADIPCRRCEDHPGQEPRR